MRTAITILTLALTLGTLPAIAGDVTRLPARAPAGNVKAQRVWARMAALKVSLDFDDTPVLEIFRYLRRVSGVNLVVDGELRRNGELDERRISLEVTDIPLRSALKLVLDFSELAARWRHGVLFVTSPENTYGATYIRLYDVRDISYKIPAFPGPTMELASGSGMDDGPGGFLDMDEAEDAAPSNEDIVEMLKSMLGEVWDRPNTACLLLGGQVLVRHSAEVHEQVGEVLAQLRASR